METDGHAWSSTVAGTASPRWRRGGLTVATCRRGGGQTHNPRHTHTHVAAAARSKRNTYHTHRFEDVFCHRHGARASNCPSKVKSPTSSSTCPPSLCAGRAALSRGRRATWPSSSGPSRRWTYQERRRACRSRGRGRRLHKDRRRTAATTTSGRERRPSTIAGATAVRSLRWRDGVVLCLRHAVGLPAATKTVAGGVRGSRSGVTLSDARRAGLDAATKTTTAAAKTRHGARVGFEAAGPRRPSEAAAAPSPGPVAALVSWDAGRGASAAAAGGLRPRAASNTAAAAARFDGGFRADLGLRRDETRRRAAAAAAAGLVRVFLRRLRRRVGARSHRAQGRSCGRAEDALARDGGLTC